jgi:AcrR family transcriptional regulator
VGRHRGDAEARLIRAALALLPRTGVSGLKVRQVAARAGVPLGAFTYYFHSRHEFCRRVLTELYGGPFIRFDAAVAEQAGGSPVRRLRHMMAAMARFARENRMLALTVLRDLLNGDPDVIGFMRWHFPLHMKQVHGLVTDCQRAGLIRRMPAAAAMSIIGATVFAPSMEAAILEHVGGIRAFAPLMRGILLTDRGLDERVDMALRALAPDRPRT